MRHRVAGYKLSRDTEHRSAMRRNMAIALFTHGQITTTLPKAKSVQPFVERMITTAKKGDLASRRRIIQQLGDPIMVRDEFDSELKRSKKQPNRPGGFQGKLLSGPRLVKHIFESVAPRFADREGGYTRIVRLGRHRLGDGGDLCVLQFVGEEEGPQVSGQFSRRREKANRRMDFAAKLRKTRASGEEAAPAAVADKAEA